MRRRFLALLCLCFCFFHGISGADIFSGLTGDTTPFVARQEKALNVLNLWRFMSPEFAQQFSPEDEAGIARVDEALGNLAKQIDDTTASISGPAEHYLVYVLARTQALNRLDFSEAALRKFYQLNPAKYPCEQRARVSEFLVPTEFLSDASSGTRLADIAERLRKEPFAKVAYDVTSRFTTPGTGFRGEVTPASAGEQRFEIYRKAVADAGLDKSAGPYDAEGGVLFVQVHQMLGKEVECYDYHKNRVVQDYGRVWLKKIYSDTVTTMTQDLQPSVVELTTSTELTDPALVVAGHTVSLAKARATLPFLMGNSQTLEFWKSIQRQALEVELYYHSDAGQQLRKSENFLQWVKILAVIRDADNRVEALADDNISTAALEDFFVRHHKRYGSIGAVSFQLYQCDKGRADNMISCAGRLEKLREAPVHVELPSGVTSFTLENVMWESRSREVQVATQSLEPGEWSQVFTEDGIPRVIYLTDIDRVKPSLNDVSDWVKHDFIMEKRQTFWRNFAGPGTAPDGGQ